MKNLHEVTYENLMNLCNNDEKQSFYFVDHVLDNITYRVFSYRLVSYQDFKLPSALMCRGIMFDISNDVPRLVCKTPNKFFNFAEGDDVDHNNSKIVHIYEKLDGSLISTFIHNGELHLKSKTSVNSQQVKDSTEWLNLECNASYKKVLYDITKSGKTVNLEWVSPKNRIVVGYGDDRLVVLNIIDMSDYSVVDGLNTEKYGLDSNLSATFIPFDDTRTTTDIVNDMYNEEVGEGYVVLMNDGIGENGTYVKVKNKKYCNLHKIKDSISNNVALCEIILDGGVDDVKDKFMHDDVIIRSIDKMENHVLPIYNKMLASTTAYHAENKELSRKDYAIKTKSELSEYFPLVMDLYLERDVDYIKFAKKNMFSLFGISNTVEF